MLKQRVTCNLANSTDNLTVFSVLNLPRKTTRSSTINAIPIGITNPANGNEVGLPIAIIIMQLVASLVAISWLDTRLGEPTF